MRPNQQNKNRSRGRNNNSRKNVNPLSRNYESNGPDVKVRGNAAHVAERYMQLARDAHSSGDSVMAENYYQHAEHYFRVLTAAQAQMPQPRTDQFDQNEDEQGQPSQSSSYQSNDDSNDSRDENDEGDRADRDRDPQPRARQNTKRSEPVDEPAAEDVSADGEDDSAEKVERPRVRRPRRRKVSETGENEGEAKAAPKAAAKIDPTSAPQPELGQLPAFLTGGPIKAAE